MKNWSITKKLLVSPVIFTISLIFLSWLSYSGIQTIRTTMDELFNQNTAKVVASMDLQHSLGDINGSMLRMIAWASTGLSEEATQAEQRQTIAQKLEAMTAQINTFTKTYNFDEEEQKAVDKIVELSGIYTKAAADVLESAAEDASMAAVFMFEVDDLFTQFNTTIGNQVVNWKASADDNFAMALKAIDKMVSLNAAIVIAVLVGTFVIAIIIATSISRPVRNITRAMQTLAGGQLDVIIPAEGRTDEVGEMASALSVFKDNLVEMENMRNSQEASRKEQEEANRQQMHCLADHLESSVSSVIHTLADKTSDILSITNSDGNASSDSDTSQSMEVAEASERTTTNADAVAAATHELSKAISEIGEQVVLSTDIANQAVHKAEAANTKVNGLAEAAQRIGEVVNLITDIAEQTNLLALNATIEAARAGDAGKGFAVVASEVKNLANQTASATDEIARQISKIQGATGEAVEAIADISATIHQIDEISASIASSVEEQNATTSEIASNVQNVSRDAQAVADRIVNMTRNAAQSHSTAIQVTWAAEDLKEPTDKLNKEVEDFLNSIRDVN
ncbi:methyl-accepting chemotaxis protein [Terasakiella pusilla]|uniref:methyl-accepting chemotaxis protein n=1 Tax=Terasakiella pusilla TaxID=64973 RepID=UPI00068B8213|nr:methyl-accepting chemotaxis protein [Terasakiella pusilla]